MCLFTVKTILYNQPISKFFLQSLNLFNATYMCEWNRSGKKVRQAIAIILDRTKYPILLKAGNFVPLTMATFIAVINRNKKLN